MTRSLIATEPDTTPAVEPLSLVRFAIEKGADAEQLERLVGLAERMDAARARKAFAAAMQELQAELPDVVKDAQNPHTRSPYARLETISDAVDPFINKHGFSTSYGTDPGAPAGTLRLYIDVQHKDGHTERRYGDFPADKSGAMNPIQGVGSTYTYARRYLKCLAFDITIRGQDDDGGRSAKPIDEEQVRILLDHINETRTDVKKFLAWAGVESLEQMPAKKFDDALAFLRRKKGGGK